MILKTLTLLQFVLADDWELRNLDASCTFGGSASLSFNYHPADGVINSSTMKVENCTYDLIVVTNDQTLDIDGKTFRSYTTTYDPTVCSGAVLSGDLSTYSSTTIFEFEAGTTVNDQFLSFRSYRIPASCSYNTTYSLEYTFGQIQKQTDVGETDDDDTQA